jgi:hypothetical protein
MLDEITVYVIISGLLQQNVKGFWLSPLIEIRAVWCVSVVAGVQLQCLALPPTMQLPTLPGCYFILPLGSHHV